MALEQDIADLIKSADRLTDTVDHKIQSIQAELNAKKAEIDSRLTAKEQAVESKIAQFQKALPLAPNTLSDTKHFAQICKDVEPGTAVDVLKAHAAPWSTFFWGGSGGTATVTKLNLSQLEEFGLAPNAEFLRRGIGSKGAVGELFYGSNYNVLVFDVEINQPSKQNANEGLLFVLNQGCHTFVGWDRGEFLTQASCWVNVLEHSGSITFYPSQNRSAAIAVGGGDEKLGWQYKHSARGGWGGCHQPLFRGLGKMKVAICLPYVGTGDHGNNMIWADSIGHPYSHVGPTIQGVN
ncbi:hypothetical protein [Pseudoalteromonas xiamenensis]|uniref:Uncharacterized protein n=1 Tax=Pseudoalteromonas xiamenensis TaxID=882626 RepID=A0A975HMC7_9GAMM|nr:hypothetical protein [Pseudoalteromonas xiamenensis]QTH70930.1 hypothetical protein J5O05_13755 [Pseudoalteromonas xiamenensis]